MSHWKIHWEEEGGGTEEAVEKEKEEEEEGEGEEKIHKEMESSDFLGNQDY